MFALSLAGIALILDLVSKFLLADVLHEVAAEILPILPVFDFESSLTFPHFRFTMS